MLETKFKIALWLVVLFMASLPIMGILRGTTPPPLEPSASESPMTGPTVVPDESPIQEEMVAIPAGQFIRGTKAGGYDEQPERRIYLDEFSIDRFELTHHQYK